MEAEIVGEVVLYVGVLFYEYCVLYSGGPVSVPLYTYAAIKSEVVRWCGPSSTTPLTTPSLTKVPPPSSCLT